MAKDKKDVEHMEGDGPYGEEFHGGDSLAVIAKKRKPALARIRGCRSTPHPAGDATLGDVEAKHNKFAVNARSPVRLDSPLPS